MASAGVGRGVSGQSFHCSEASSAAAELFLYHFGSVLRSNLKWPLNAIVSRRINFPATAAGLRLAQAKNLSGTPTTTSVSPPLGLAAEE